MPILSIDVGNTSVHYGLVQEKNVSAPQDAPTHGLGKPGHPLEAGLQAAVATARPIGAVYCSVVPAINPDLEAVLARIAPGLPIHHLTCENCPVPIQYPKPREIGEDRLANAVAATILCGPPAVVIDMGTAVTFDILSSRGYEGGIIAPGLALMTEYLHEKTALLPKLDPEDLLCSAGIGKSTVDAMKVGMAVGFSGMISALLERVREELRERGEGAPHVAATGGTIGALPKEWLGSIRFIPHITLIGLAAAFAMREAPPSWPITTMV